MNTQIMDHNQGHWILAKMGKRILRPGGKELTLKLIENLDIHPTDRVVEFAPGLGITAQLVLQKNPKSYIGVEQTKEAAVSLQDKIKGENRKIINASAQESTLSSNSADKVYGEAMLTMHPDAKKKEIMQEAFRLLGNGGMYGIHELALTPNNIGEEMKAEVQKGLAQSIKVNARPLTEKEWSDLLEEVGFKVVKISTNPMALLERKRILSDEGFFRACKICFNILTHKKERKRILKMRSIFLKYKDNMNAISIVAMKP